MIHFVTYGFKIDGAMNNGAARRPRGDRQPRRIGKHIRFLHAIFDSVVQFSTGSCEFILIFNKDDRRLGRIERYVRHAKI